MKKLLVLTGIVSFIGLNEPCIAQTGPVTATPSTTGGIVSNGTGSVSTKSAIGAAETDRAVQEARKMKALKAAMTDKSFQHRQPVAYTAAQYLAINRPPPMPVSTSESNTPYLVPETYPRTSVPAFKPAKKNQDTGGNEDSGGNPYSYPGRVSENEESASSPPAVVAANSGSGLPKKRPNFFKWMKQKKASSSAANAQVGNTTSTTQSDFSVPDAPAVVKKEAEEKVTGPVVNSTRSVPAPPPSASATPVAPSIPASPAAPSKVSTTSSTGKPSAVATPSTTPNSGSNGGGLFGKLFNKQGKKKSSRTISSDPAQPSASENIELPEN